VNSPRHGCAPWTGSGAVSRQSAAVPQPQARTARQVQQLEAARVRIGLTLLFATAPSWTPPLPTGRRSAVSAIAITIPASSETAVARVSPLALSVGKREGFFRSSRHLRYLCGVGSA
jgi:hypothetical protein